MCEGKEGFIPFIGSLIDLHLYQESQVDFETKIWRLIDSAGTENQNFLFIGSLSHFIFTVYASRI